MAHKEQKFVYATKSWVSGEAAKANRAIKAKVTALAHKNKGLPPVHRGKSLVSHTLHWPYRRRNRSVFVCYLKRQQRATITEEEVGGDF